MAAGIGWVPLRCARCGAEQMVAVRCDAPDRLEVDPADLVMARLFAAAHAGPVTVWAE